MAIGSLALAGGNFLLYILLRQTHRWLAYLQLFLLFIFAFVVTDRDFSVFYLLMFIIAILISELNPQVKTEHQSSAIAKTGTLGKTILFLSIGVVTYIFIALTSARVGGNIVGTPDLSFHTTQDISNLFKPTLEASLGIIENFFVFSVFEAMMVFGLALPLIGKLIELTFLIPMLFTAFLMGVFHVAAYSVSVALIIWATLAFFIFIALWYFFKDSLPADTAHYLNNLIVSSSRNLQVVF